jgi:hypothetical protein
MVVLYLAVAVVMLTLATQLLLGNVKGDLRGAELIHLPPEAGDDPVSDR